MGKLARDPMVITFALTAAIMVILYRRYLERSLDLQAIAYGETSELLDRIASAVETPDTPPVADQELEDRLAAAWVEERLAAVEAVADANGGDPA